MQTAHFHSTAISNTQPDVRREAQTQDRKQNTTLWLSNIRRTVSLSITVSYLFRNGLAFIPNEKGQLNHRQLLGEGAAALSW